MDEKLTRSNAGLDEAVALAETQRCTAWGRSGIGGRKENQDCFSGMVSGENVILTVCDGMGGMNGGQTASSIAVAEIVSALSDTKDKDIDEDAIKNAVNAANEAIYRQAMDEPALRGMGTTATVLVITPQAAYLTHVGDSRIYQLRKGQKVFRTFDHSKVFDMVKQKMITEEQARTSSFANIITRALGIRPKVEMTVETLPYKKGDRFVLCCDGIWNAQAETEMLKLFCDKNDAEQTLNTLTETINAIGINQGGHHDNLTAIIADVRQDSKFQHGGWAGFKRKLKGMSLFGRKK